MPPPSDLAAWAIPAEPEEIEECSAFLITAIEPELAKNPKRVGTLVGLIGMQDYTRAELLLAMKRMPFQNAYAGGFRLDVLDALIQESRNTRRIIGDATDGRPRLLTERQMFEACQNHPDTFRPENFGIADYDINDRPLYRYAKDGKKHAHNPVPQLPEASTPLRADGGGQGFSFDPDALRGDSPKAA